MGEWSEYFEDFPEENPANYDRNGRYVNPNSRVSKEMSQQDLANQKLDEILKKKGLLKYLKRGKT